MILKTFSFLNSRHVTRIAKYIKSKRPKVKLFIWHDMISQLLGAGNNNVKKKKYIYICFIQVPVLFFFLLIDRLQN